MYGKNHATQTFFSNRGRVKKRENEGGEKNEGRAESCGLCSVLGDDMRGNELPHFIHQTRDAPHHPDCQRFL